MKEKILVIDDDPTLLKLLGLSLKEEGYEFDSALDGMEGLRRAYAHRPDLIILDVMMPRMDGMETCRRLREVCDTPIIMLTAKGDLPYRLEGLSLGADDYVPKPFDIDELLLRIQAVLRRAKGSPTDRPLHYEDGWLTIDLEFQKVWRKGELAQLTPREFDLLAYLFGNAGRSLSNEDILTKVWGPEYVGADWLKVHIRHLRQKIEPDPSHPQYILTAPEGGYQFRSLAAKN
jgi:DNA-binding response OmpR family regulator